MRKPSCHCVTAVYLGKTGEQSVGGPSTLGQIGTLRNKKSVQEVSKHSGRGAPRAHYGKTDLRYWQTAVFQPRYTRNGVAQRSSEWAIKIQHLGRRETSPLCTANRTAAAAKAKRIYLTLKASGWETALTEFNRVGPPSHTPRAGACRLLELLARAPRRHRRSTIPARLWRNRSAAHLNLSPRQWRWLTKSTPTPSFGNRFTTICGFSIPNGFSQMANPPCVILTRRASWNCSTL